jgi:DNA-binding response OmpR family regulator
MVSGFRSSSSRPRATTKCSRALGAGAAAFLAKPFNGEVLLAEGALGKR